MATAADNLQAALDSVAANLAAICASPLPTYSLDGRNVSWTEYFTALTNQHEALYLALIRVQGPSETRSRGI